MCFGKDTNDCEDPVCLRTIDNFRDDENHDIKSPQYLKTCHLLQIFHLYVLMIFIDLV